MFLNNFNRRSGGITMYIKDKFKNVTLREDLNKSDRNLESLFLEFDNGNNNVLVGTIYRRPDGNINTFLEDLDGILSVIVEENKLIYLMGDFNLNLLKSNVSIAISKFVNMLHGYNLFNTISKPTRVTSSSATLIDHIWTNDYCSLTYNGIIFSKISDHFPIFSTFKLERDQPVKSNFIEFRDFSENNIELFKLALENTNWDLTKCSNNPDVCYKNFELIFSALFNRYFPLISKKIINHKFSKPYINQNIKDLMKERNKLQRKYSRFPITYGPQYRSIRNRVNKLIDQSKHKYYKDKLNHSNGDSKKIWNVVNEILQRSNSRLRTSEFFVNNELITDPQTVTEEFNAHYATIGQTLSNDIPNMEDCDFRDYLGPSIQNNFELGETSYDEILNVVNRLGDVSPGYDNVPGKLIKQIINYIIDPIKHICNCSFYSGTFPSSLKIAKVIPIYKKGNKKEISNYRPISILPVMSKILERLVCDRLTEHLDNLNVIIKEQHGFIQGKSTTSAILSFTDNIMKCFDEKNYTIGVFLDFTKAFETVNHDILLHKLEHIGIRNVSLSWFKSYLNARKQFVSYNDKNSSLQELSYSVPQGSILGPQLFIIYINDMINSIHKSNISLFADDTCLYYSHRDLHQLISIANEELARLNNWLVVNKLTLNAEKSHYIIFRRKIPIPQDMTDIKIDNKLLQRASKTNFLGVTISESLNWRFHIQDMLKKLNRQKAILYLTRNSLTRNSLRLIYFSLVYPILIYNIIIWGKTPNCNLKPLVTLQKCIIRTIMYRPRNYHTNNDFSQLKILKLKDVHFYFSCIFVFKSLNGLIFPFDYYNLLNNSHYNLRNNNLNIVLPLMGSHQSQSSPAYYGCIFWNSLPAEVRTSCSIYSFKFRLKKYLPEKYTEN